MMETQFYIMHMPNSIQTHTQLCAHTYMQNLILVTTIILLGQIIMLRFLMHNAQGNQLTERRFIIHEETVCCLLGSGSRYKFGKICSCPNVCVTSDCFLFFAIALDQPTNKQKRKPIGILSGSKTAKPYNRDTLGIGVPCCKKIRFRPRN